MPKVIIDQNRCEGKKDCCKVCPERVFKMKKPENLSLLIRLKVRFHGGLQAFAIREQACTACMKCVAACPERAITVLP